MLRLDHLAMTPLVSRDVRPALADWYGRVRSRPCFETAVARWTPAAAVEFLQASGAAVWPDIEPLVARG